MKMRMIKSTGLVPVKVLKRSLGLKAGAIIGVIPEKARKGLEAGEVTLVDIPDSYETVEVPGPVTIPAKPVAVPEVTQASLVQIPEDWEKLHHLKIIQLGEQIAGKKLKKDEDSSATDKAKAVITEELERRAAAEPGA